MFVTPLYAGILTLFFLLLSGRVASLRHRMPFGDGGDVHVTRIIRGQANFAEYVPLALLLMGFLEVTRFSIYLLHALGIALVIGRLLHGAAFSFGWNVRFGRFVGTTITFVVLLIEALLCLYQGFRGQSIWFG